MKIKISLIILLILFAAFQLALADPPYQINPNSCNNCGNCVSHCPENAIYYDYEMSFYQIDQILCEGCGDCVDWCNHNAIHPTQAVGGNSGQFSELMIKCVPNPVKNSAKIYYNLPQNTNSAIAIFIYNSKGQKIQSFRISNPQDSDFVEWDLKNLQGNIVSSGTYFYEIKSEIGSIVKTLTLIN